MQHETIDIMNGLTSSDVLEREYIDEFKSEVTFVHPETLDIIKVIETFEFDENSDASVSSFDIVSVEANCLSLAQLKYYKGQFATLLGNEEKK